MTSAPGFHEPKTRKQLLDLIADDPTLLVSEEESQWLDFKLEPHLKPGGKTEPHHRFELAKDVTAMANAGGGLIVWGVKEHRDPVATRRTIAAINGVGAGVVDRSQFFKTIDEWVFPTSVQIQLLEKPLPSGSTLWIIDVEEQRPFDLPFLVVREWPSDATGAKPNRGHFTMYRRRGTDNLLVRPEEIYRWIHDGYHGSSGTTARIAGPHAGPHGLRGGPDATQSLDDALATEVRHLSVADDQTYYFIQAQPIAESKLTRFWGPAESSVESQLSRFQPVRPRGFSCFSPYATTERTNNNTLHRGLAEKGGALVERNGTVTFVCCESMLTWASEQYAFEGQRVLNPFTLPEFTLDACRFVIDVIATRMRPPHEFTWRVGLKNVSHKAPVFLLRGKPDALTAKLGWDLVRPHPSVDFVANATNVPSSDPERAAFAILLEVFDHFGYDQDAIPFAQGDRISTAAIGGR